MISDFFRNGVYVVRPLPTRFMYTHPQHQHVVQRVCGTRGSGLSTHVASAQMQFSDTCVATKDLTKSFGWDSVDAFMQHDIQELNRMLTDKLDEKMKASCARVARS